MRTTIEYSDTGVTGILVTRQRTGRLSWLAWVWIVATLLAALVALALGGPLPAVATLAVGAMTFFTGARERRGGVTEVDITNQRNLMLAIVPVGRPFSVDGRVLTIDDLSLDLQQVDLRASSCGVTLEHPLGTSVVLDWEEADMESIERLSRALLEAGGHDPQSTDSWRVTDSYDG